MHVSSFDVPLTALVVRVAACGCEKLFDNLTWHLRTRTCVDRHDCARLFGHPERQARESEVVVLVNWPNTCDDRERHLETPNDAPTRVCTPHGPERSGFFVSDVARPVRWHPSPSTAVGTRIAHPHNFPKNKLDFPPVEAQCIGRRSPYGTMNFRARSSSGTRSRCTWRSPERNRSVRDSR